MKPIEPGCLAIFVHGDHSGLTVTVGSCVGNFADQGEFTLRSIKGQLWEVSPSVTYHVPTVGDVDCTVAHERDLMRVDGDDEQFIAERMNDRIRDLLDRHLLREAQR